MRIALGVEYMGTNFHGWQLQKSGIRTVQQVVEKALSKVADHPVRVFCSGRTDAGVHAIEQVIHFETHAIREDKAWLFGGNVNLPADVNFTWSKRVDDDFHARFSAIARRYNYKIHNTKVRSSIIGQHSLWEPRALNIDDMDKAAQFLLGTHDFSAYRGSLCQAKSPIKTIEFIRLTQHSEEILLDIKANAFLHHMVRNIVGTLLKVGKGERPASWVKEVLESKDRKQAGATAQPQGLYFVKAFYENL
ncbi:tRNA pseudouridine(38-40) synthase TruA [Candidatus Thioglobus sp.]|jgi:tRNA pseudouridine38-40 synthase|uniref:tRNA pseudouridine(38-40) synthase TruA n=1 Tax=Candidatus Thioglobus sp. TaxID=2026721 RepID=UPI001E199A60|nr:tRNA pseudouridine(38-40) synthase TruA [Candidatus Thioglobus sp.]MBT3277584.1 tRNA pseudouridine(38-40) synthase TruA [Candidatus Thioglobus sp.]MBT3446766.1 tRNA pseudouridine(38-40) synthase TruA [Candidatus Thioglobus sp.]MBT3744292.1 tRNA pseudouridine(38-40) synthase TruA [Candidatus Thioglobus sp.]MBT4000813.1 tRNA pseudouridine(38-40) synthase TruA [Candidatus Thioglobus sp.]MBT4181821.1 tRNA pseudouridine(38-40) synthase TruA [Candidatus Thioglobus sp.]